MKPDFEAMSLKQLRGYVLEHREDEEAFHAMVDRYESEYPNRPTYPAPKTPEDFAEMSRIIAEQVRKYEAKGGAE